MQAPENPGGKQSFTLSSDGEKAKVDVRLSQTLTLSGFFYLRATQNVSLSRCVWGEFSYHDAVQMLGKFDGCMVILPPCGTKPPLPPEPEPHAESNLTGPSPIPEISSSSGSDDDLFPYIYMRHWPNLDKKDQLINFIQYESTEGEVPQDSFITQLITLHDSGDVNARDSMQALAQSYIESVPPFEGEYVGNLVQLGMPMSDFPKVVDYVRAHPGIQVNELGDVLLELIDMGLVELKAYLSSNEFEKRLQQVWASYFSLIIILGYSHKNLLQLTWVLCGWYLMKVCFVDSDKAGVSISITQLQELAYASVTLPSSIFPLPPMMRGFSTHSEETTGWIEPYAMGDLQLLRQRFLGFRVGDVAHIENVMAGERREVVHKQSNSEFVTQQESSHKADEIESVDSEQDTTFVDELKKMVEEVTVTDDYKNLNTSYGPPTQSTTDGSITHTTTAGQNPGVNDRTCLARKVLEKSVNRFSHRVGILRGSSTIDVSEMHRKSIFDNSQSQRDHVGVYRWLNREYEAYVVNYGNRLMLELMIMNPADSFLRREKQVGLNMKKPLELRQQGIRCYSDITPQNSIELSSYYGVEQVSPPPEASKVVSFSLRGGGEESVSIPAGYRVAEASVEAVLSPTEGGAPIVLVGGNAITVNTSLKGVEYFGEEGRLPVISLQPPLTGSPLSEQDFVVSVRVYCEVVPTRYSEWQIATYNALHRGYREQAEQYYRLAGARAEKCRVPPNTARRIEKKTLKRDCINLLLQRHTALTGENVTGMDTSPPSPFTVNEPRYLQFFDGALEWGEMSYSFYSGGSKFVPDYLNESSNDDPLFAAFLEADMARVMLPVSPARARAMVYYLSSGMLWFGDDQAVAVSEQDIELTFELKQVLALPAQKETLVGKPWKVVMPTTMQVLDNRRDLAWLRNSEDESGVDPVH